MTHTRHCRSAGHFAALNAPSALRIMMSLLFIHFRPAVAGISVGRHGIHHFDRVGSAALRLRLEWVPLYSSTGHLLSEPNPDAEHSIHAAVAFCGPLVLTRRAKHLLCFSACTNRAKLAKLWSGH